MNATDIEYGSVHRDKLVTGSLIITKTGYLKMTLKASILLLFLVVFSSCATDKPSDFDNAIYPNGGETVEDGLKWYNVVEPAIIGDDGKTVFGTMVSISTEDQDVMATNGFAMIERDDTKNLVGSSIGDIVEGDQQYIQSFDIQLSPTYSVKISQGNDLTLEQWNQFKLLESDIVTSGHSISFYFNMVTGHETIPIGSELAILNVYDNAECTGEALETFKLVL